MGDAPVRPEKFAHVVIRTNRFRETVRVELRIDNFESVADLHEWFRTPAFARNPIGVEFDPDVLVARYREGLTREDLQDRDVLAA